MIYDFSNSSLKKINSETILSSISEEGIFEKYKGIKIEGNKLYKCDFHEDGTPSLGFYRSSKYLRYRCFGCGATGNAFEYVMEVYGLSYFDALKKIANDFDIVNIDSSETIVSSERVNKINQEGRTLIHPSFRTFNAVDYSYWSQYSISLERLLEYKVRPCSSVYVTSRSGRYFQYALHSNSNPIYCYEFCSSYKIYRPLSRNGIGKWLQNSTIWDIQGIEQLPESNELLIITSSLKDVMVLRELGYWAVAPNGEGVDIPDKIIDYLWSVSDNIVVLYDSDEAGYKFGNAIADKIGTKAIFIPEEYKDKDISDFVKSNSIEEGVKLINNIIND